MIGDKAGLSMSARGWEKEREDMEQNIASKRDREVTETIIRRQTAEDLMQCWYKAAGVAVPAWDDLHDDFQRGFMALAERELMFRRNLARYAPRTEYSDLVSGADVAGQS